MQEDVSEAGRRGGNAAPRRAVENTKASLFGLGGLGSLENCCTYNNCCCMVVISTEVAY